LYYHENDDESSDINCYNYYNFIYFNCSTLINFSKAPVHCVPFGMSSEVIIKTEHLLKGVNKPDTIKILNQ